MRNLGLRPRVDDVADSAISVAPIERLHEPKRGRTNLSRQNSRLAVLVEHRKQCLIRGQNHRLSEQKSGNLAPTIVLYSG